MCQKIEGHRPMVTVGVHFSCAVVAILNYQKKGTVTVDEQKHLAFCSGVLAERMCLYPSAEPIRETINQILNGAMVSSSRLQACRDYCQYLAHAYLEKANKPN